MATDTGFDASAAIDLLLTIGYIDGHLHEDEQALIRRYLDRLVELHPTSAAAIEATYVRLGEEIKALAEEVVAAGDTDYLATRLKVRAVALFRGFSPADQRIALDLMSAVAHADGTISPHESDLHDELVAYFHAEPSLLAPTAMPGADLPQVLAPELLPLPESLASPLLEATEHPYAADPIALRHQFGSDYQLIFQAINIWEQHRSVGNGRLLGVGSVDQLAPGTSFLDGHVHVVRPNGPTELVVLGDLHGCYSCLKAALLQSRFIERATLRQQDPTSPDIKLVLLGDYLDRGRFGFEGVLRAVLQLKATFPEQVVLLRGNHEYLVRIGDQVASAVTPAEAVPGIADRAPSNLLEAYRHLFEHMPTSLLFDRTLFVHGGVPRDDTLADRYQDLSSLNDSVLRFEMMWSDPEQVDRVPGELQATSRFSFGRDQFAAFMDRVRCTAMIRGHEQVDAGFVTNFDLGRARMYTLFSAGGRDNEDLPTESRYRAVSPMALTVRWNDGLTTATPWPIEYRPFTTGANNGLYR